MDHYRDNQSELERYAARIIRERASKAARSRWDSEGAHERASEAQRKAWKKRARKGKKKAGPKTLQLDKSLT